MGPIKTLAALLIVVKVASAGNTFMPKDGQKPKNNPGEFGPDWELKIRTCFARLDFNGDGVMSKEDFDQFAKRFIEVGSLTGEAATNIETVYNNIWVTYFKPANSDTSTSDSFVANLKAAGKAMITGASTEIHNLYFTNTDRDGSGQVDLDEFTKYFYILGINVAYAEDTFNGVNYKTDDNISRDEFVTAANNFFTSEIIDKRSGLFFGPLLKKN